MPYLILLNAQNLPGKEWELDSAPLTVGRGEQAKVQIADPRLSRLHFEVSCLNGNYQLTDLGSSGGTTLNDAAITSTTLKAGDSRFYFDVGMDTMLDSSSAHNNAGNESMVGSFIRELRDDKK
jgi:pSer/pThr/pTyr-binding forkhead associated (FHA) protein